MSVAAHLAAILADGEPRSVTVIMRALRDAGGHGVSRSLVERTLRDDAAFVRAGTDAKPLWQFVENAEPKHPAVSGELPPLWPWQQAALLAWSQTCLGVIEAVTGTGKTRVAFAAAHMVLQQGGRVLVLVPGTELLIQWEREMRRLGVRVGRLGAGGDDDLFACEVLIATAASASRVEVDLPPGTLGLVIADEVHRFGAETWSKALPESFGLRLALTATLAREDDGVDTYVTPYFGDTVFTYDFAAAVRDQVIAPFSVAMLPVTFTDPEAAAYQTAQQRVTGAYRAVHAATAMPSEPRAFLQAVAARVAAAERAGHDTPIAKLCREYLYWVRQRREIAATADSKFTTLAALAPSLATKRTLVFTDTVEQAVRAAQLVNRAGVRAETLHGELDERRRKARLHAFRSGDTRVIVAPRVLDEGVDVPDADVAVVLSAFQTRRQMVQRLGRIVRLKPEGQPATCVVLYVATSREDPANGGYASFLAEVTGAARQVALHANLSQVQGWLSSG